MKKKLFIIVLFTFCFLVTGCARTITYKTLEEKVNNKESFVVLVIQNGCSHCENFQPVFDEFSSENKIDYVKLNLTNINNIDKQDLNAKYNISGTPTVLIFKEGKELQEYRISGEVKKDILKETFKKAGYIK